AGYLIAVTPRLSNIARLSENNPLTIMGRHALPVFVSGTILSMAAQALRLTHEIGFMGDIAIVAVGIAAQMALAYYIEWYRGIVRVSKPLPVSAVHGPVRPAHVPTLRKAKLAEA